MVAKILVIEDEVAIATSIAYGLRREGHEVLTAADGVTGLEVARRECPDLVILDIMLPRMDGIDVCRSLRQSQSATVRQVPVLLLTARTEEADRVVGLDVGADDYVTKPFSMRELSARVKAVLRRSAHRPDSDTPPRPLAIGSIQVNLEQRRVTRDGQAVALKPREFDLLACLMQYPGRVFTRESLLDRAWGTDFVGDMRTVDVHIRWLREKLEIDPGEPELIETIRGVGYRIRATA